VRPRYFVLLGACEAARKAAVGGLSHVDGFSIAHEDDQVFVITNGSTRRLGLRDDAGVVLGTLFHRHGPPRAIEALEPAEADAVIQTGGSKLIESYWGGYIAIIKAADSILVMRDPSGALPCYYVARQGVVTLASDVELLVQTGSLMPEICWEGLARHLYGGGLPTSQTALADVSDLLAGTAMHFGAHACQSNPIWSPWDHVEIDPGRDVEANAERLRRTVQASVTAWARQFNHALLGVSGGIDSSIVAACLVRTSVDFSCLTMFTGDPVGDERAFAKALCDRVGIGLLARPYRLQDVDINVAAGAHLPRPIGRSSSLAYETTLRAAACQLGADCFFTGNGGDNVFAHSQSATAILDRLLFEGPGRNVLGTLIDVCKLTGCGPLQALRHAFAVARRRSRAYPWKADRRLLSPAILAELGELDLVHPWLDAPRTALPGKSAHIAALLRAQYTLEPGRSRLAPVINPLLSQPVMEACLAIPTWQWCAGGLNRSVARRAFSADLPDVLLHRKSKGGPDGFSVRIISAHRSQIRERLRSGQLARHGLLDVDALENALRPDQTSRPETYVRLLDLVDTEAWIEYWTANRSAGYSDARRSFSSLSASQ
jgi:asparagine synthase (glutamine-hydrolysing)